MDHFGIGAAISGAVRTFFRSARQTGRTTSLVESVKDGDRIVFTHLREADRVKRMLKERNLKVDCIVIDPRDPAKLFEYGPSTGRTIFDHSWVEDFYVMSIERIARDLDHFQRESSGFGTAHIETAERAREIKKWMF